HARYGSLPWARLLQPGITLAREGFEIPADLVAMAQDKIADVAGDTNFASHFGNMRTGELFRQPALAATLTRIAADPEDFYRGKTARLLVAQMQRSGGLITLRDLADYRAKWRDPLQLTWRNFTVLSAPPPSSGSIALLQLLAPDYLAERARGIDALRISAPSAVPPGLESPDTTHFSILDSDGNAVALTYTLNWDFGAGVVVEGAGFLLNNEMDNFSAKPGVPNAFGVIGNERNAIAPGKRMLSSMTPTVLLENGRPALVLGTPGGSTIFTSVFQVILNLYDFAMPLQAAVDATRFHHQLPEAFLLRHDQRRIDAGVRQDLQDMGYTVVPNDWGDLGDIQAIQVTARGIEAAADSRGRGVARSIDE
ncbi:MAG: gamma-glutamyltransferase, partial [Chromatocurvus sp.]